MHSPCQPTPSVSVFPLQRELTSNPTHPTYLRTGPQLVSCPDLAVEELVPEALGHAGLVYEHVLGEDKFTFVEEVQNPHSCTILIKASRQRGGVGGVGV